MIPSREFVHSALKELGPKLLKKNYASDWSKENYTYGYCYVVSEALFHYIKEEKVEVYCMNLGEEYGTHWFLKVNDKIVDYTREQFPFEVDYQKAVRKGFLKGGIETNKGYISKRGFEFAKLLKLAS